MKHKHSEVIKAFVDGIECEVLSEIFKVWCKVERLNEFDSCINARIKPEPKPDIAKKFYINYLGKIPVMDIHSQTYNLRLIWDGETGEFKSAEVI
jgi:hypothetical protein